MNERNTGLPGWVLPAGLAALVITLVTIALVRDPVSYDPDTPEGTVQEYLVAINEERWEDAIEIVHEDWRGACEANDLKRVANPEDFTAQFGNQTGFPRDRSFPAPEGTNLTIPDDATLVEVTISHRDAGDLGGGWSEAVAFELVDDGEFWWLINDPWPHFIWSCRE